MSVELLNNLPPEIQAFIEGHPERAQIEAAFNNPAENIRNISRLMQGAETEQEEQILRLIGLTLNTDSNFAELVADESWRRLQEDVERKAEYIRENAAYSFDEARPEGLSGNDAALFAMERFAADYIDAKRIEAINIVPAEELTESAIAFRDDYNATRLAETMAAQGDIDTTIAALAEEGDFAQIYAIANAELTKIAEFGGESEDVLNRAAELASVANTAATINMIGLENYQNLTMLQEAGDYAGIAALTGQILADNADNAAIQQNFGPLHTQTQILAAIGEDNYAELERLGQEENFAGLAQLAESLIAENADNAAVTENIGLVLADANARIRAAEVAEGNYSTEIEELLANGSTDELLAATLYHAHHSSQAAYALRAVDEDGQVTIQNGAEYLAEAQLYDGLSDRLFETAYNARAEEIIEKYGLYGEPANAIRNNRPGAFQDSYRPYGLSDEAVAEARELFTMNTIRDLQGDIKYSVNNRSTTLLERRLERLEAGEYELSEAQTQTAIEQVRAAIEFVEQSPEKELLQETMATVANIEHLRTMEVFFNETVADYGYDGNIFTSADMMSEADMANTESFQKASAILFEREYGMTWEEADALDGSVDGIVDTDAFKTIGWEYGEVTLGQWGINFMSEEENQLAEVLSKGFDFYIADGYSQEEQVALLYAAEAFHRTENSWESFWRAAGNTVTDEANLVSIPAMIASFGASSAAVEAGKQTARIGLVKAISRAVVLDLGRIEGVQGALDGGLRADLDQRLRIRTGFMDEENYSVMSTVTGAAVGGVAELALGRTIQVGAGLAGRFVSDTVVPGVRRVADILPPLRRQAEAAPEVRAEAPAALVEPEIATDAAPEFAPAADAPARAETVEPELADPAAPEIAPEAVPAIETPVVGERIDAELAQPEIAEDVAPEVTTAVDTPVRADTVEPELATPAAPEAAAEALPPLETPAVETTIDADIVEPEVVPNSIDALRIPAAEAADPAPAANSPAPLGEPAVPANPNVIQFTPPASPISVMPTAPRFGALDLANPNRGLAAAPGPIDGYTPRPGRTDLNTPSEPDVTPEADLTPAELQARQRAEQAARQEQQPRAAQEWQPMQQQQQQARAGGTPDATPSYRMPPRWKQADADELARTINSESDAGRIAYMLGKIDAERGEIFSDVFSAMRTSKQEAYIMNIYNNDPAAARAIMIDLPEAIQTRLNTAIEGARRLEENIGGGTTPPPRPVEPTPEPRVEEPAARPAEEPRAAEEPRVEATEEPAARPAEEPRTEATEEPTARPEETTPPKDYSDVTATLWDRIGNVRNWFRSSDDIQKIKVENLRQADEAAARRAAERAAAATPRRDVGGPATLRPEERQALFTNARNITAQPKEGNGIISRGVHIEGSWRDFKKATKGDSTTKRLVTLTKRLEDNPTISAEAKQLIMDQIDELSTPSKQLNRLFQIFTEMDSSRISKGFNELVDPADQADYLRTQLNKTTWLSKKQKETIAQEVAALPDDASRVARLLDVLEPTDYHRIARQVQGASTVEQKASILTKVIDDALQDTPPELRNMQMRFWLENKNNVLTEIRDIAYKNTSDADEARAVLKAAYAPYYNNDLLTFRTRKYDENGYTTPNGNLLNVAKRIDDIRGTHYNGTVWGDPKDARSVYAKIFDLGERLRHAPKEEHAAIQKSAAEAYRTLLDTEGVSAVEMFEMSITMRIMQQRGYLLGELNPDNPNVIGRNVTDKFLLNNLSLQAFANKPVSGWNADKAVFDFHYDRRLRMLRTNPMHPESQMMIVRGVQSLFGIRPIGQGGSSNYIPSLKGIAETYIINAGSLWTVPTRRLMDSIPMKNIVMPIAIATTVGSTLTSLVDYSLDGEFDNPISYIGAPSAFLIREVGLPTVIDLPNFLATNVLRNGYNAGLHAFGYDHEYTFDPNGVDYITSDFLTDHEFRAQVLGGEDTPEDDRPTPSPAAGFTTGAANPDTVTPPAGTADETEVADAADAADADAADADADPAGTTGEETEVAAADDAPETPGNGADDAPDTPVTDEQRRAAERNRILAARRRDTGGNGYSTEEVIQAVLPGAAGEALTSATSRIELGRIWDTAKGWFGDLGLMAGNLWSAMGQMQGPWGGIAQIGTAIVGAMMGKNLIMGTWNLLTTGANWKNMAITGGLGIAALHAFNYFSGQAETSDRVLTNSDYRSAYAGLGTESIQNYGGRGAAYDTTTGDVQLDSHYVAPTTGEVMTAQLGQDPATTATLAAAQDAMRAQMDPAALARIEFNEAANGIDATRQVAALDVTLGDIAVTDDMRVTGHDGVPYTLASVASFDLETGVPTQNWTALGELARAGEELAAEENYGYVASQQGLGVQNVGTFVGGTFAVAALDEDEKLAASRYLPASLRGSNDIIVDVTPQIAALDTIGWREETAKGTGTLTPDAEIAAQGPVSFASLAAEPEQPVGLA